MCHVNRAGDIVERCQFYKGLIDALKEASELDDFKAREKIKKGMAEHYQQSWDKTILGDMPVTC